MAPLLPLRRRPLSRVTRRSRHVLHTQARGAGDTWRGAGFNQPGTLLDRLRRRHRLAADARTLEAVPPARRSWSRLWEVWWDAMRAARAQGVSLTAYS